MLVETDPVDWSKPIVHMDKAGKITSALLVSKNTKQSGYASTANYYGIMLYQESGDRVLAVNPEGKNVAGERCIFNTDAKNILNDKHYDPDIVKSAAKNIHHLGEF